jgi:hypothetical protein
VKLDGLPFFLGVAFFERLVDPFAMVTLVCSG